MNHSHEDIYNHNINQAMQYCDIAKSCLLNNNIEEAKGLLYKAFQCFEIAVSVGKKFNYERAAFAEAKRKECLDTMRDLEFGRVRKVAENLER